MANQISTEVAAEIADLTFQLLANCQEKEERLAAQFHISVPEFRVLRSFKNEGSLPLRTILLRVPVSNSRLTRILETLEAKNFLAREIDPGDRRSVVISLSPKGSALAHSLEQRYVQIHEEILAGIPESSHEPLLEGLRNLFKSLQHWLAEG